MSKQTAQQQKEQKEQMKRLYERNRNTQPTLIEEFDPDNIIFDAPAFGSVPGKPITFHRINIGYRNSDKTDGELVFELKDYSSFGIQENRDDATGLLKGYSVGFALGEYQQEATDYDKKVVDVFDAIVSKCKKHLLQPEVYEKCGLEELYETDLRKMAPHSQRKDKLTKKVIPDSHYSIYPKLMWTDEKEYIDDKTGDKKIVPSKFKTELWDDNEAQLGNKVDINPLDCIGKRCRIRPFVKVRCVFMGEKIKLQLELYAAGIAIQQQEKQAAYKSLFRFNAPRQIETQIINESIQEEENKVEEEEVFSVPVKVVSGSYNPVDNDMAMSDDEEEIKPKKPVKGKGKK
jgi:hypothetical protein